MLLKIDHENDKKQAKILIRYLLFYCCLITVMSFVSFASDIIFIKIYHGADYHAVQSPFLYTLYYMILGYMIFPVSLLYNYVINHLPNILFLRMLLGIYAALLFGFFINERYLFGFYIGEYRVAKNVFAMVISGVLVEVIRFYVVQYRQKKIRDRIEDELYDIR